MGKIEERLEKVEEKLDALVRAMGEHVGSHREELGGMEGWKDLARELRKQNGELHDRLMAREYPELKRFSLPEERWRGEEEYNPLEDEDLSGASLTQEELDEISAKGED